MVASLQYRDYENTSHECSCEGESLSAFGCLAKLVTYVCRGFYAPLGLIPHRLIDVRYVVRSSAVDLGYVGIPLRISTPFLILSTRMFLYYSLYVATPHALGARWMGVALVLLQECIVSIRILSIGIS